MTLELSSYDRRSYIVAVAIRNNVDPSKNIFQQFAKKVFAKFPVSERTRKSDIDHVISSWYRDKWKMMVENSPYFDKEETEQWIRQH